MEQQTVIGDPASVTRNTNVDPSIKEFDFNLLKEIDDSNIEKYETHLQWLLSEGQGETFYEIGLDSTGSSEGLDQQNYDTAVANLNKVATKSKAIVSLVCERTGKGGKVGSFLVREAAPEICVDVRYCVCGNVDSGKSTMVGVLTRGQLDNGRGLVRINCFAHKHEIDTGRTSSISQQIMGFNVKGECVNQVLMDSSASHAYSWGDIIENSYKVISFLDLAGHEKYLKTTVSGMTGHMPDYCLLLIGANMGVTRMTKEHLGIALALKIPVIVVITKIDMCPANVLKQTMSDLQKILKMRGVRKISLVVRTQDDLITAIKSINNDRIIPIFMLSNVTGENLDAFRKFLNVVPPRIQWDLLREKPAEVLIDQTYFVTGVGTVVGGTVMAGKVPAGQTLLLGPDGNGAFMPVQIKSVHSKRVPVKQVVAGQSAGFALKKIKRSMIRKGMVLVDPSEKPQATWTFEADIIVLYHSTTIHTNYQPVVQCMTIRQSAKIIKILERDVLRTGDKANVRFKFLYRPEYLKVGMRLIFREGRCKGLGIISKVRDVPDEEIAVPPAPVTQPAEGDTTSPSVTTAPKETAPVPVPQPVVPTTPAVSTQPQTVSTTQQTQTDTKTTTTVTTATTATTATTTAKTTTTATTATATTAKTTTQGTAKTQSQPATSVTQGGAKPAASTTQPATKAAQAPKTTQPASQPTTQTQKTAQPPKPQPTAKTPNQQQPKQQQQPKTAPKQTNKPKK